MEDLKEQDNLVKKKLQIYLIHLLKYNLCH